MRCKVTLTLLRRSQWANWVRRPVATRVNDKQQRLEPKLQIRYTNQISLVRKAASTFDLNFPSQVHLCENDARSKKQYLRQVSSASQAEFTCVKRTRGSAKIVQLLFVHLGETGETGETPHKIRIREERKSLREHHYCLHG